MTTADVLEAEFALLGTVGRARVMVAVLLIRLGLGIAPAPVATAAMGNAETLVDDVDEKP